MGDPTRAEFRFPANPSAPMLARAAVASMTGLIPTGRTADLALLVSELVTNAVKHSGMPSRQDVIIRVGLRPIHVEVMDEGPGFVPAGRLDGDTGWGLRILDRLAIRWGLRREAGRNVVWFDL
jgi:anti-sigma regulatory factor (Ser/Thr protein kinase)